MALKASTDAVAAGAAVGEWLLSLSAEKQDQVAGVLDIKHIGRDGVEFHKRDGGHELALRPESQPVAFQHSRTPGGIPACLENALKAVGYLGIDCKYDIFHDRIVVAGHAYGWGRNVLSNMENIARAILRSLGARRALSEPE